MKPLLHISLLLFLSPLLAFAQLIQGEIIINNAGVYSGVQTLDGGYMLLATSDTSFNFIKLDSKGNVQWAKLVAAGFITEANSIAQTQDGGYAATGYTSDYGSGGWDVYVVKLDQNGNLKWTRTIGGPDDDFGNSILQTKDGGYAIAGQTHSYGSGAPGYGDIWVIKLDSVGNKVWTKTVNGPWGSNDVAYSIIQTKDGGYAITGSVENAIGGSDVFVCQLDYIGNLKWSEAIGSPNSSGNGYSIIQTKDGGFAITGDSISNSKGRVYVIKLDSLGNIVWTRTIGGSRVDVGDGIVQTKDESYVILGGTDSFGPDTTSIYLIKLDSLGNLKWTKVFGESEYNYATSIIQTNDRGFAITAEGNGISFLKLDSLGNTCMPADSGGTVSNGGTVIKGGMITSSDSGRMGSGGTISSGGVTETILCREVLGIPELVVDNGVSIYPVPTTGKITISLNGKGYKSITIYDVFGREILKKELNPDGWDSRIDANLSNFSNGLYCVQINKTNEIITRKIIIQK